MRFRSSLSHSSLYGREARARGAGTSRRITTLIIALVLVILLMQQASDPEVYRRFFARLGTPLSGEAMPKAAEADPRAVRPAAPLSEAPQPDPDWAAALRDLPDDQLRTLAAAVLRVSDAQALAGDVAILAAGADAVAEQDASLARALEARAQGGQGRVREVPDRLIASIAAALLAKIDDPTVLRGGEGQSLLYWLAEGRGPRAARPLGVGVVPLVDQSDVYRGRAVRITGRAVRTEAVEAPENPFGVSTVSRVWLHPDDGSERPLVVLADQIPREVAAVDPSGIAEDGPRVEAVGTYVTRLAYRSGQGVDVAPLLVGEVHLLRAPPQPAALESTSGGALPPVGWLVASTAIVGLLVAAAVYWYTERAARARRQLRQRATRPSSGAFSELASPSRPRSDSDAASDSSRTS